MQPNGFDEFFGDPIDVYTRQQALRDGALVDVTETAREAGFKVDTALTAALYADVSDLSGTLCHGVESCKGRLWDVLSVARLQVKKHQRSSSFTYEITMPVGNAEFYEITVVIGPGDDKRPVLTLMRPDED